MVRSMTGYGRAQRTADGRDITVEIRSVNHKYFEFSFRSPRSCAYMEDRVRALLQKSISRGKVECFISVGSDKSSGEVAVDMGLAKGYVDALRSLSRELKLKDDLRLSSLLEFHDIFSVEKETYDEETLWKDVSLAVGDALSAFMDMREAEGEKLAADVNGRAKSVLDMVSRIEVRSPEIVSAYRERLTAKIAEILADRNVDEARILTEAAVFADKIAVDEETVRLRSHVSQLETMLLAGGPVGRKLDFLLQEMNREANTIGSKNSDLEITGIVVELKSELEKIREQIQNIE